MNRTRIKTVNCFTAVFLIAAWPFNAVVASTPVLKVVPNGVPETIRDWEKNRCSNFDTPDTPPRAYRDAEGLVHFFSTESEFREYTGPSLDTVTYNCRVIHKSAENDKFENFEDRQWFAATYTLDGNTVYALVHNEYHGHLRSTVCPSRSYANCWGNVLTLAVSHDRGRSFQQQKPPNNLVAMPPFRYVGDFGRPTGYFQPSNIVHLNGFYYALFKATQFFQQKNGVCLMRTDRLDDPRSWRGWDGSGFSVQFINPYNSDIVEPSGHVCTPLKAKLLTMGGIARDETSGAFVLVMQGEMSKSSGIRTSGIWATSSYNLIEWSAPILVWADAAGAGSPPTDVDPALLDISSGSRNFETFKDRPYVYFVRFSPSGRPYNRKLMRVPVRIEIH
jgi:hypothetical protein